jgi:hypothetical protein
VRRAATALLAGLLAASAAAGAVAAARHPVPDVTRLDPRVLVLRDPAASPDIRALARNPPVAGAGVSRASTSYGDVTGDGRPDALVQVRSGGAAGTVAYFVYAVRDGRVRDVLPVNDVFGADVAIVAGRIVQRLPLWSARDAPCCPGRVAITVFRWDDGHMATQASSTRPLHGPGQDFRRRALN